MDFYAPLFSKIVDSSLWSEPDYVVKVFLTMIAKKDRDQVCRGNAYNIGQWARKSEKEVLDALRILSSPDTKRLEKQPHEGRRIAKVDDGWLILNGKYYEAQMQIINRRAYKASKEKEYRKRSKKDQPLPGEAAGVKAHGDGDEDGFNNAVTRRLPSALQ